MAVAGPPGGLGEAGRAVVLPEAVGETGESEDWEGGFVSCAVFRWECFGSLRCWSRAFGVGGCVPL